MENSLLVGLSRQMSLQRELEVVANNIANLNTTGFKADGAIFQEYLMPTARDNEFRRGDQRISFVQDRATWHDFRSGPAQSTGSPLDVSIDGDAFFAVQSPRGERYTRNGSFQINATGQLVTSAGDAVLGEGGPITFQPGDRAINITANGTISVREGANTDVDSVRGKLRLVRFAQAGRLQKDGTSLFVASPQAQQQPADNTVRVVQGSIEKSNVNGVVEMARMIEITRSYTQVATLLQQSADLRRTAIERLAEVPA